MEVLDGMRPMLMDLYTAWKTVPYHWALIGHCLYCSSVAPDLKAISFFVHFWASFLTGFGGGHLSSILVMVRNRVRMQLGAGGFKQPSSKLSHCERCPGPVHAPSDASCSF